MVEMDVDLYGKMEGGDKRRRSLEHCFCLTAF